jgi:protein involved in polysaccharide export with SLBB domain
LKRAAFSAVMMLCMVGLMLMGSGCLSLFSGRDRMESPVVLEAADPVAQVPDIQEVAEQPALDQPLEDPVLPWYKRMWRRGEPAVVPAEMAAESEETVPVEAVPAVLVTETDVQAEPVPEGVVTNLPAGRPWYIFWSRKPRLNADEEALAAAASATNGPALPSGKEMFSASGDPLIKPGYTLRLSVTAGGKIEMAEQVKTVSDKGDITLPLIGTVECEGKTVQELAAQLEKQYEQFIREPQAAVEFVYGDRAGEISPWGSVVVQGYVRQPGRVNIPPTRDLTLSRAIQFSGGAEKDAKQEAIVVTRRNKDGTTRQMIINMVEAAKRGDSEKDITLEHGDRVYVPQSNW